MVVFVVDVLYSLTEHIIDRIYRFLDVLRTRFEEVADCWHAVLHLGLTDVIQVYEKLFYVFTGLVT